MFEQNPRLPATTTTKKVATVTRTLARLIVLLGWEHSKQELLCLGEDSPTRTGFDDEVWDEWAPWGSCSATCGVGTKAAVGLPIRVDVFVPAW